MSDWIRTAPLVEAREDGVSLRELELKKQAATEVYQALIVFDEKLPLIANADGIKVLGKRMTEDTEAMRQKTFKLINEIQERIYVKETAKQLNFPF